MNNFVSKRCKMYAAGLSSQCVRLIIQHSGLDAKMMQEVGEDFRFLPAQADEQSGIIWITLEAWKNLPPLKKSIVENMSRVLLVPENMSIEEINSFGSEGFSAVLCKPLNADNVRQATSQALESYNIYRDIFRMTREIFLEREVLARKNSNLYFLVNFLSATSGLLLPHEILVMARQHLSELLPVQDVGVFLWSFDDSLQPDEAPLPTMFIPALLETPEWQKWSQTLMDAGKSITHGKFNGVERQSLPAFNWAEEDVLAKPRILDQELSIALPLRIHNKTVGVLIISLSEEFSLARDNLEVLESAMAHLALALRSTWLYKQVKSKAERDGLTGLYNRRYFDERLEHEMKRHERYGHEFALIFLDIDHFKAVNDTYGHLMGDDILRELADLLANEMRYADCMARYGGEEFVLILPYTSGEKALGLAERLRQMISEHSFCAGGINGKVTASFGVTSFVAGQQLTPQELFSQADKALYSAKNQGRNRTVLYTYTPILAKTGSTQVRL